MGRISQWAVRQPIVALVTWLVLMIGIVVASVLYGGEYNDDFELPEHRVDDGARAARPALGFCRYWCRA